MFDLLSFTGLEAFLGYTQPFVASLCLVAAQWRSV